MIKKLMLVVFCTIGFVHAQQKFVCVDPGRILQESKLVKEKEAKLKSSVEQYQKQLDEKNRKLEELKKQIESKGISQKAREEKIKEYQRIEAEGMELQQKAQKELSELKAKIEEELLAKVRSISEELAKKQGFTGILDCSAFVYKTADIDITVEVIQRLDQQK